MRYLQPLCCVCLHKVTHDAIVAVTASMYGGSNRYSCQISARLLRGIFVLS